MDDEAEVHTLDDHTGGKGDQYPVGAVGRVSGAVVMVPGVGIIGALASTFAGVLIHAPEKQRRRSTS